MRRDQGAALSEMAEAIEAMGGSKGEILTRVEAMLKDQALASLPHMHLHAHTSMCARRRCTC
jgi:hypothetical protein